MKRNLGGFNPNLKEFIEKRPNLTIMGLGWGVYWRIGLIVLAVELLLFVPLIFLGAFNQDSFNLTAEQVIDLEMQAEADFKAAGGLYE